MGDGVKPGEEDDRIGRGDVEGDVLVELDDTVERRAPKQRNERTADGEENHSHIDMKHQSRSSRYGKCEAKCLLRALQALLLGIVHAAESEHQPV